MTGGDFPPLLSVVIVSWNTLDLTERCLRTLREESLPERTQVILVDNGSLDGTADMVRTRYPEVLVIANASNDGYTRANNQGIALARGRYLLLLNSDAFMAPGCLTRLIDVLERNPRIAVVAPRLVYGDGRWQRWTAGSAPTLWTAANHYLFFERLMPGRRPFAGLYLSADVRHPRRVDWVSSACLLVRADALRAVGGLDERLFVYMDDVDLCQRLRDRGWEVWYCPQAEAVHLMGQVVRGQPSAAPLAALRSFERYFAQRHGPGALLALRTIQVVGFSARAAIYRLASVFWRRPALAQESKAHFASLMLILRGGVDTQ